MKLRWTVTQLIKTHQVNGLAIDDHGEIYFTVDQSCFKLDKHGCKSKIFSNPRYELQGLLYHGNNLFIAETTTSRILQWNLETSSLSFFTGKSARQSPGYKDGPLDEAKFCFPSEIHVDSNDNLYVTDWNHLRKVSLRDGIVETVAGSTTNNEKYHQDGEARSSKFYNPRGFILEGENTFYVMDSGNLCIRKIKDGIVSTVVGKGCPSSGSYSPFYYPRTMIKDQDGSLFVSDGFRIMKVNLQTLQVKEEQEFSFRIFAIASIGRGSYVVGTSHGVFQLEFAWKTMRLLWIAKLKEDSSYCFLATLPKDLIIQLSYYIFAPTNL